MMDVTQCVMTCSHAMSPIYSFTTGVGNTREYYVKCCESGVDGGSAICKPPVPGLDFIEQCVSIFPWLPANSSCNCGQDCVGTVVDNSICLGVCTCTGLVCSQTTGVPTIEQTASPTNIPTSFPTTKSPTSAPTKTPTVITSPLTKTITKTKKSTPSIKELEAAAVESVEKSIPVTPYNEEITTKGELLVIIIGVIFGAIIILIILYNLFFQKRTPRKPKK